MTSIGGTRIEELTMRLTSMLLLTAMLTASCTTGRDFGKPSPENFVLGKTTRVEIIASYGPPQGHSESTMTSRLPGQAEGAPAAAPSEAPSALITSLRYFFADRSPGVQLAGYAQVEKRIVFELWNDVLIAYTFTSNRPAEANFNERKIPSIEAGKTTKAQIVELFGAPVGRAVFPAVRNPTDQKYLYYYFQIAKYDGARKAKRLEIIFDGNGRVREYSYGSDFGAVLNVPTPPPVNEPAPSGQPTSSADHLGAIG
jgi:hypothetical protein